jgi:hypothetical protein
MGQLATVVQPWLRFNLVTLVYIAGSRQAIEGVTQQETLIETSLHFGFYKIANFGF